VTPDEHERIRELLAGHALHALDADEAARADELLGSHVPSCPECSADLDAFQIVAGELGLAAGSRRPPHVLGSRIRRETSARRIASMVTRAAGVAAAAALVGVLVWNVLLTGRVSDAEMRSARQTEVLVAVSHPESKVVPMVAAGADVDQQLTAAFVPGKRLLYLFGSLPSPSGGLVYQVWLVQKGVFRDAGTFVPEGGVVLLRIDADATSYDGLLITEEPTSGSQAPSARHVVTASF
jgi:hypothetical protein